MAVPKAECSDVPKTFFDIIVSICTFAIFNPHNNFLDFVLSKSSSPFLNLRYVLSIILNFGHFSASCSYRKVLVKKVFSFNRI